MKLSSSNIALTDAKQLWQQSLTKFNCLIMRDPSNNTLMRCGYWCNQFIIEPFTINYLVFGELSFARSVFLTGFLLKHYQ
jgi:hypothetical protein